MASTNRQYARYLARMTRETVKMCVVFKTYSVVFPSHDLSVQFFLALKTLIPGSVEIMHDVAVEDAYPYRISVAEFNEFCVGLIRDCVQHGHETEATKLLKLQESFLSENICAPWLLDEALGADFMKEYIRGNIHFLFAHL